jgi:hypothetical protein
MTTMTTAVKGWVAAGSSATLLLGGLVLGAPAAVAAPGDAACLQASGQFNAALVAAGITAGSVTQLEQAAEAVVVAEEQYFALLDAAAGDLYAQLETALEDLDAAEAAGDPEAVTATEARVLELEAALELALDTPEILAAEQVLYDTTDALDAQLSVLALDEASSERLLALFKQFLAACEGVGGGAPVTAPVGNPVAPAPVAPAPAAPAPAPDAPVTVEPVVIAAPAAPAPAASVAVNPGLNIQTAAGAEREPHPGAALVAALLAAGIAVPAATALRMHRLQRRGA